MSTTKSKTVRIGDKKFVDISEVDTASDDYRGELHIEGPDGRRWEFGITDDRTIEERGIYRGQRQIHVSERPDWLVDVLREIGFPEVGV